MEAASPGLRILLVEDEPANRALVRSILARSPRPELRGSVLHEAASIAEAAAVIASQPLDIVLVDVRLPDGSGLDLVAELQGRRTASPARIVIVSASVLAGERAKALSSGADAFLGKPFGASELADLLVDVSAGAQDHSSASPTPRSSFPNVTSSRSSADRTSAARRPT